ncbi:hypothetical protein ACLOJK_025340 [Asimina triloba]
MKEYKLPPGGQCLVGSSVPSPLSRLMSLDLIVSPSERMDNTALGGTWCGKGVGLCGVLHMIRGESRSWFVPDRQRSVIAAELESFRKKYNIPSEFELIALELHDKP